MTYRTTVGITVFGEPAGYSASALISEFQSFLAANSQFNVVVITRSIQPALSDVEFYTWDGGLSYALTPWTLSSANKQKLPPDVQCNIILYDWKGKPPAFGGGTWGGDTGTNGVPFIAIPLGIAPGFDLNPWGSWTRGLSQALVHEWIHAIDWIVELLGYPTSPLHNLDNCPDLGYTYSSDPGWVNCLKYLLSTITTPMYSSLENWHKLSSVSPANISILINETVQFVAKDIYNNWLTTGVVWTKNFGPGSISITGLYTAGGTPDNVTVWATYSGITKTASIIVRGPSLIVSTDLTVDTNICTEMCSVNGTASWINNGGTAGTLDPAILINTVPMSIGLPTTINPGQTLPYTFSLPDLTVGTYDICTSPGTHCQTVVVNAQPVAEAGFGMFMIAGLAVGTLLMGNKRV